jgi:hypothetical protein
MPIGGLLALHESNAPLITGGCIGGEDAVPEAGSRMDLVWYPGLSEEGQVDVLGLQRPADQDEAAVPAVLDVVRGQFKARGAGLWLLLLVLLL